MAVQPFKVFVAGEILTASDLNASFAQVFDNGQTLGWPATASKDFDGNKLILDSDGNSSIHASSDDQLDFEIAAADHFRMLLSSTVPDFRVISYDAGATAEPYVSLVRDSASPADDDLLGRINFIGDDSGGNETVYGYIQAQISDVTDATEDGRLLFNIPVGGVDKEILRIGGGYTVRINSEDTGATAGPTLVIHRSTSGGSAADDDFIGEIEFSGGDDGDNSTEYAKIGAQIDDTTDGTEDAALILSVQKAGTLTNTLEINPTGIVVTGDIFDGASKIHALADGLSAVQASTSGTTVDFTSIRADAKRITINFIGVSTDGSNQLLIQIGDSGGLEVLSYVSNCLAMNAADSNTETSSATGFVLTADNGSTQVHSGSIILTLADAATNTWVAHGVLTTSAGTAIGNLSSGFKALSGVLDRLTITTAGTPDDFDAGSISILVE